MTSRTVHVSTAAVLLALTACAKPDNPTPTAVAVPSEAPTIAITATPVASASASAVASASASASASARARPSAAAVVASAAPVNDVPLRPASTRIAGKNFTLDAASPGCRVDTPCTLTLRLAATGEYHVNKEYPYKFTAAASPGVTFLGNGDPSTFSRASGDFRDDGEKSATMTVRFKPTAAGEARVSGTYKMSVCSAENCQIETQTVALGVPVL